MKKTEKTNNTFLHYTTSIPLVLTLVVFGGLVALLYSTILILNLFPLGEKIVPVIRLNDILIGSTIYLKTSVDFAMLMGRLMSANPGWKKRIAIETGTGLGNALGTICVLILWTFFKEVKWILAAMIFVASLVLFELAYGGLSHFSDWGKKKGFKPMMYNVIHRFLTTVNHLTDPVLSRILPNVGEKMNTATALPFFSLLTFSFTIPFILGLDDFAGYVPLFNVVNVFGFSVGVFFAHMILNAALFLSPEHTIRAVKNAWISFIGSLVFIGLAFWGLYEVVKILFFH